MLFDVIGDGTLLKSEFLRLHEVALHLPVEPVPHQFQQDIGITVDAGALSLICQFLEDIPDVRHVEVAAHTEILGLPVVPPQERMDIRKATLAGSGVPEVAHVKLSRKEKVRFRKRNIRQLLLREVPVMLVHIGEDLGDGILSLSPLTEHVFVAGQGVQLDRSQTGALLTTVVLFLHHQIEFVQTVHPGAILLLIILQRLQQPDHCHTAIFMNVLFHL